MRRPLDYGAATVVHAEGARVGILACPVCGAAILVDPRDEDWFAAINLHDRWHEEDGDAR